MKPVQTDRSNVNLTLSGGTEANDLPAERVLVYDTDRGETEADARLAFESLWMPDEAEARKLEAGAAIVLRVWAIQNEQGHHTQPPVSIGVSDAVLPERELLARSTIDTAIGKLFADLKERIAAALVSAQHEGATADDMVDTGGEVNPEAVGFPSPPAFSDLWIAALQAAQGVAAAVDEIGTPAGHPAEADPQPLEETDPDGTDIEPSAGDEPHTKADVRKLTMLPKAPPQLGACFIHGAYPVGEDGEGRCPKCEAAKNVDAIVERAERDGQVEKTAGEKFDALTRGDDEPFVCPECGVEKTVRDFPTPEACSECDRRAAKEDGDA